ncbi:MAG: hypothetical protein MUC92_09840 [Fimbriimonadaceae bacterium]|nr:hypothetical protein [Fimbriimonadaceae bacterium]
MNEAKVTSGAPVARIDQRYLQVGIAMAVIGALGFATSFAGGQKAWASSWLIGWTFWMCLSLGCFALSLLFHITRGRWGTPILRLFEAGGGPVTLGVMGLLGTPILFSLPVLYKWVNPDPTDIPVMAKVAYLNAGGFTFRYILFFALMVGMAYLLQHWTRQEEKTGDKKFSNYRNNTTGAFIVLFVLIVTFLTTDLYMSLDPHWFSTLWGVWFVVGSALGAMAFTVFTVAQYAKNTPYVDTVDELMKKDFGNLLLMLTMLWAYFSFSHFLIIWSGNLPEFTSFYLNRSRGNFNAVGLANILGQFFIPFLLLLSPRVKREFALLGFVAGLIFLVRINDLNYMIAPFFRETWLPGLGEIGAFLLAGGIWLIVYSRQVRTAPLTVDASPYEAKLKEVEAHA